ncbi:unnamed protein product [Xylocopa violacea]|uniref:Uncharacterized protein n=1 Tax=Xylocopa violacea TaxID=135666 RepID=A0ABP1NCY8_XYLVO
MENSVQGKVSDEEAEKMLDEIIEEDKKENLDRDDDEDDDDELECTAACAKGSLDLGKKLCECMRIAENSSRFTLRVMEAMRRLQRAEDALLPSSTAEEIVDHMKRNYRYDGDLYAQVRTALKQVCSQGFVMELLKNEYHLIGTHAISVNQITCLNDRTDCLLSSSIKPLKRRRKNDDRDDCVCETPPDEGPARARRKRRISINESRKATRRQREQRGQDDADEPDDCDCDVETIDEDARECSCEAEAHKGTSRRQRARDVQENRRVGEKKQSRAIEEPLTNSSRRNNINERKRTTETVEKIAADNRGLNEIASDDVDDIYEELQDRIPRGSKKREKELKAWIKRCQKECKQRSNQRARNN